MMAQANAVHLSAELPLLHDRAHRVLYPASAKAGSDLQVPPFSPPCRDNSAGLAL